MSAGKWGVVVNTVGFVMVAAATVSFSRDPDGYLGAGGWLSGRLERRFGVRNADRACGWIHVFGWSLVAIGCALQILD